MNNHHPKTAPHGVVPSLLKTSVLLALSISLAALFWMASLPIARAAAIGPAEMIQTHLPHSMSLTSAPKADVLAAVCQAVTKNQKEAPGIVRTAAGARKDLAADILKTAVHCLKADGEHPDCELARATLRAATAVAAEQADALTELFIGLTPGCVDSPGEGPDASSGGASNVNGAPGSGGGGGAASGDACSVCHNNQSVQVACSDLSSYLKSHPGDTAGACEATPNSNR